ncbi:MAG TPA: hypothetical protein VK363_06435, partial [Pyrinomonadaceae bacterium]|nr:hypothetical protein [Pyrinomonadaceae bacterium]
MRKFSWRDGAWRSCWRRGALVAPVLLSLVACLACVFAQQDRGASQPQVRPRRVASAPGGNTTTIRAGGNLQQALDRAQPGDTLLLEAGASFTGTYTLPAKRVGDASGANWITIRTSAPDSELPPAGTRITPAHAPLLPKLLSPGKNAPALQTAAGAHHYRLVGLEIAPASASAEITNLVTLGDGSEAQNKMETVPHHLSIERCYIHAYPEQALRRGIALNSASTDILDSHLSDFKATVDAQAIWGWNGPGPFRIINNYL